MDNRLYVVVRNDIPCVGKGFKAAQSGHAVAQYLIEHKPHETGEWNNDYLIFLQAGSVEFKKLMTKLEIKNIKHSQFHEPDHGGIMTSIAVLNNRNLFKRLKPL